MTAVRGGRGGQRTLFRGSIRLDGGTHSDWRLRHTNALSGRVHATHFGSTSQVQHYSIHSSAVPRTDFTSEGRGLRSCRRLCRWARVVAGILAPRVCGAVAYVSYTAPNLIQPPRACDCSCLVIVRTDCKPQVQDCPTSLPPTETGLSPT